MYYDIIWYNIGCFVRSCFQGTGIHVVPSTGWAWVFNQFSCFQFGKQRIWLFQTPEPLLMFTSTCPISVNHTDSFDPVWRYSQSVLINSVCKKSIWGSQITDTLLIFTSRCPVKAQSFEGLGPIFQIEFSKADRFPLLREEQGETCRGAKPPRRQKYVSVTFGTSQPEQVLTCSLVKHIWEVSSKENKHLWEALGTPAPTQLRAPRPANLHSARTCPRM